MGTIELKRVYDPASEWNGYRILVDRIWPRGIKKETLKLDGWAKSIAPTTEIRKKFNHDPEAFPAFRRAYLRELEENPEAADFKQEIIGMLEKQSVTFLYAAKTREYNQAVVLKEWIEEG